MAKLVLHIPGGGMRDVALDRDRVSIGRRADNDVCLQYPAVSADHAEIVTVRGDSFLHDLGSTNGTLVNGNRVVKHFLQDRDTIDIGRVQLVYLVDEHEVIAPLESDVTRSTSIEQPRSIEEPTSDVAALVGNEHAESAADRNQPAPVDELLADLMASNSVAAVAVEIPSTISTVSATRGGAIGEQELRTDVMSGVYVEVMNGPNAGHIAPMTRREFVLGQAGATKAVIKRDEDGFSLVPVDLNSLTRVNGERVRPEGVRLAFGDTIDVVGVMLRFGRRPPL